MAGGVGQPLQQHHYGAIFFGRAGQHMHQGNAETRDRTGDLQIFSLTLSQLSYRGRCKPVHAAQNLPDWPRHGLKALSWRMLASYESFAAQGTDVLVARLDDRGSGIWLQASASLA